MANDSVQETSATTGTGTWSLAGPSTGHRSFATHVPSGSQCYYHATDGSSTEDGIGTFTSGTTNTLSRDTVTASTTGSAINFLTTVTLTLGSLPAGGGSGTVTSIATTAPLAGGTITGTGTLSITGAAGKLLAGSTPAFTATPTLGVATSTLGTLSLCGNTSGTALITPQAAAGTPTLTLPNASGTFAISATSPIALSATTGALTLSTVPVASGGTGAVTLAAHGVVIGNGTSAVNVTGTGSSGQVLCSNGASADPTYQNVSAVASGAMVLLEQHTASSSASLDFTTAFTSTYDVYQFQLVGLTPASDTELYMTISTDGGSTWLAGILYVWSLFTTISSLSGVASGAGNAQWQLTSNGRFGSTSGYSLSGQLHVYNMLNATKYVSWTGNVINMLSAISVSSHMGGMYKAGNTANAIRFAAASGNIASGTIRCFGIGK